MRKTKRKGLFKYGLLLSVLMVFTSLLTPRSAAAAVTGNEFAIYSTTDNGLKFYNRTGGPTKTGGSYDGRTVTAIYTGFMDTSKKPAWRYDVDTTNKYYLTITNVEFVDEIAPVSLEKWFMNFKSLKDIDMSKLNTSQCTTMYDMFSGCKALKYVDVSHFDTSQVQDMNSMFNHCEALGYLDVSGWNTSNVTRFAYFARDCKNLKYLDVSGWNVSAGQSFARMFSMCNSLMELDTSNWVMGDSVTDMDGMFLGCSNLREIDISGFKSQKNKGTTSGGLLQGCDSLKKVICGSKFEFNPALSLGTDNDVDGTDEIDPNVYFPKLENNACWWQWNSTKKAYVKVSDNGGTPKSTTNTTYVRSIPQVLFLSYMIGHDTNNTGKTYSSPFQTLAKVYQYVKDNPADTIVYMTGAYPVYEDITLTEHKFIGEYTAPSGIDIGQYQIEFRRWHTAKDGTTKNTENMFEVMPPSGSIAYSLDVSDIVIDGCMRSKGQDKHSTLSTYERYTGVDRVCSIAVNPGATFTVGDGAIIKNSGSTIKQVVGSSGKTVSGGAINSQGTVTINGGLLYKNESNTGGAIYNGGALIINNGLIINNEGINDAGAIYNAKSLKMYGGVISRNFAKQNTDGNTVCGGGIYNAASASAETVLYSGLISSNEAQAGAGVFLDTGSVLKSWSDPNKNYNIVISGNRGTSGAGIYCRGALTFSTGNVRGNVASGSGGGIYINNSTSQDAQIASAGVIAHNRASAYGAGLYINHNTTFKGKIRGNVLTPSTERGYGAGLYLKEGKTLTISGGQLRFNKGMTTIAKTETETKTLTTYGGGLSASGDVILTSCSILYNETTGAGGGMNINSAGTLNASGTGVQIKYNKANNGGGISNFGTTTIDTIGEISNNKATEYGGGLYNRGTVTFASTTVTKNTAKDGGGVHNKEATLTINSGEFSNNTATNTGGGIGNTGTFNLNGGTISKNTAGSTGGGINNASTLEMKGGTITENTAFGGGGINNESGATFNLTGGTISNNVSLNASNGGGVRNLGTMTATGGTISGNTADSGGAIFNNGTLRVSAGVAIQNNKAVKGSGDEATGCGGAIFVGPQSSSTIIDGGTISGNTATDAGDGIGVNGPITMKDAALVNAADEVYLYKDRYITVSTALTASGKVATIVPNSYENGRRVAVSTYGSKLGSNIYGKFTLQAKDSFVLRPGDYLNDSFATSHSLTDADVIISSPLTVTYNGNSTGTVSNLPSAQSPYWGETMTISSNTPTQTGYTFQKWNTVANGSGTSYNKGTSAAFEKNTTLYAQWAANSYTVTLSKGTGISSATGAGTYSYGASVTAKATASTGYTFKNWTDASSNVKSTSTSYTFNMPASNVALTANATENTYTIAFNANGGSNSMSSITGIKYTASQSLTANAFTRTGYTFNGWNTKSDGSGTSYKDKASVSKLTATNGATVTLYAQWKANTGTIHYNDGSNLFNGVVDVGVTAGSKMTYTVTDGVFEVTAGNASDGYGYTYLHADLVAGETYTFSAETDGTWTAQTEAFLMKDKSTAESYYHMSSKTKTFTPTVSGTYWLRLDVNTANDTRHFSNIRIVKGSAASGITGYTPAQEYTYGTSTIIKENKFTRKGYAFIGWNTKADGSGTSYQPGASVSNLATSGDVTLYAQWAPIYKVTLDNQGADQSGTMAYWYIFNTKKVINGTTVYYYADEDCTTPLADGCMIDMPIKSGYGFRGYFTETSGNGIKYVDADGKCSNNLYETVASDSTLYAYWEAGIHKVTFNPNGGALKNPGGNLNNGSNTDSISVTYGKSNYYAMPGDIPTKTGYNFTGWYTAPSDGAQVYNAAGYAIQGTGYWNTSNQWVYEGDVTVYAHWELAQFTVTLDKSAGIDTVSGAGTYTYGSAVTINTTVKTGYTWLNWTDSNGNVVSTNKQHSFTMPAKALTYKANATPNIYKVTLDNQGADIEPGTPAYWFEFGTTRVVNGITAYYYSDASCTTPLKDGYFIIVPKKNGYTFGGYYTQPNGVGTQYVSTAGGGINNLWSKQASDITLYAYWLPNDYTLSIDPNGGYRTSDNSTAVISVTKKMGATEGISPRARTGYTLAGYIMKNTATGSTASGDLGNAKFTFAGTSSSSTFTQGYVDITLVAQWNPNIYKVTLDNQGATTAGTANYWYKFNTTGTYNGNTVYYWTNADCTTGLVGSKIQLPTKKGYGFGGYYTGTNGSGTQYVNASGTCVNNLYKAVANDITLYAKWTPTTYTISYDANGGSGSMDSHSVAYGSAVKIKNNGFTAPTGMKFAGWTTKSDGTNDGYGWSTTSALGWQGTWSYVNGQYGIANNALKLYAQWQPITYTVKFDPNNGVGTMENQSHTYGQTYSLTNNTFTREGYSFNGWNTKADGSGTNYSNGHVVSNLAATDAAQITLYAQWKVDNYTISYDLDGGSLNSSNPTSYNITSATITLNAPIKTGYTFTGWTGSNGTTPQTNVSIANGSTGNKTFKANWRPNTYTVILNPNGAPGDATLSTFTYGVEQNLPANPFTYDKYEFVGWNTKADGSGTTYEDEEKVLNLRESGSIILYAQWEAAKPVGGKFVYIGDSYTTNANDNNDGLTPETPIATFKQAYTNLPEGGTIYVVSDVRMTGADITLAGTYYKDNTTEIRLGQDAEGNQYKVDIKRYSQPTAHAELSGYNKVSNSNYMIQCGANMTLTLEDIVIDGHSEAYESEDPRFAAPAVKDTTKGMIWSKGNIIAKNVTFKNGDSANYSGGVESFTNGQFTNCTFINISSGGGYGALYNGGTLVVADSLFQDNSATYVAAIGMGYHRDATLPRVSTITNTKFINNSAEQHAAALHLAGESTVSNCEFKGNTAGSYASAIFASTSDTIQILDCTIEGNLAKGNQASTMMLQGASGKYIVDGCTIKDNKNPTSGTSYTGGILLQDATLTVTDSLFEGNTAYNSGAIYASGSATLNIGEGAIFKNNSSKYYGGAITFYGGNLNVYGGHFIDNTTVYEGNAIYAASQNLIFNISGTPIFEDSTNNYPSVVNMSYGKELNVSGGTFRNVNRGVALLIGDTVEKATVSGGVFEDISGEAIRNINGNTIINDVTIRRCSNGVVNAGSLVINGGTFTENTGPAIDNYSQMIINDATVTNNSSSSGAIVSRNNVGDSYNYPEITIINGGTVMNNNGYGLYATSGTLQFAKDAKIDDNNPVYLGTVIDVISELTHDKVATITPSSYSLLRTLVRVAYPEGNPLTAEAVYGQFSLTPNASYTLRPGNLVDDARLVADTDLVISRAHKITYNANTTDATLANMPTETVAYYAESTKLSDLVPTRETYSFTAWGENYGAYGNMYDAGSTILLTDDITLYAQWAEMQYIITFNPNGGQLKTPGTNLNNGTNANSITTSIGSYYGNSMNGDIPTREGYSFKGWYSAPVGGTQIYERTGYVLNEGTYWQDNKWKYPNDLTVYAQWIPYTYTVSFNANGGSGSMPTQNFTVGVSQSIAKNEFTRIYHNFVGWNTKADGSGTSYSDMQVVTDLTVTNNGNVELFAQWNAASTPRLAFIDGINGDDNNDGWVADRPVKTFKQAYTNLPDGGKIFVVNTVTISDDMTLGGYSYKDSTTSIEVDDVSIYRYSPLYETKGQILDGFTTPAFTGNMINVQNGAVLTLDESTIDGSANAGYSIYWNGIFCKYDAVSANGSIILNNGKLVSNKGLLVSNNSSTDGGIIYNNGELEMSDSQVYGGSGRKGGGIYSTGTAVIANSSFGYNSAVAGGSIYTYDTNGLLTIENSSFVDDRATNYGGAINTTGKAGATISNSEFKDCQANLGGAICTSVKLILTDLDCQNNYAYRGGAIAAEGDAKLTIDGGVYKYNSATQGGVVYVGTEDIHYIEDGEFSYNYADHGGVAYTDWGSIVFRGGEYHHNEAELGGAVYSDSPFEYWTTNIAGGNFYQNIANSGGAAYTEDALMISGGQIHHNKADLNGGAVALASDSAKALITNSNIAGNTAGDGKSNGVYVSGELYLAEMATIADDTYLVQNTRNGLNSTGIIIVVDELQEDLVARVAVENPVMDAVVVKVIYPEEEPLAASTVFDKFVLINTPDYTLVPGDYGVGTNSFYNAIQLGKFAQQTKEEMYYWGENFTLYTPNTPGINIADWLDKDTDPAKSHQVGSDYFITQDKALYGEHVATPKLIAMANGGEFADGTKTKLLGTNSLLVTEMPDVTFGDYEFLGWSLTQEYDSNNMFELSDYEPKGTQIVYAIWGIPTSFVIYSEDDNSLRFYNRPEIPEAGDTFNGLTVSEIWVDVVDVPYENDELYPGWIRSSCKDKITTVIVEDSLAPISTAMWFSKLSKVNYIDATLLDTSRTTNMALMFQWSGREANGNITVIGLENWDTSNVRQMGRMFAGFGDSSYGRHTRQISIDITGWDFSKVEYIDNMWGTSAISEIKVGDKIQFTSTDIYDEGWFHDCYDCRWYNVDTEERYESPRDIPEFTAALYRIEVKE